VLPWNHIGIELSRDPLAPRSNPDGRITGIAPPFLGHTYDHSTRICRELVIICSILDEEKDAVRGFESAENASILHVKVDRDYASNVGNCNMVPDAMEIMCETLVCRWGQRFGKDGVHEHEEATVPPTPAPPNM
jgi:hypothetical protein